MELFLKLLLAHLVGDFFLQSNRGVQSKENRKIKSPYLYFHCLLHVILAMLATFDLNFWPYALLIGLSHYLIDLAKLYFQQKRWQVEALIIDQLLHLLVIVGVVTVHSGYEHISSLKDLYHPQQLLLYCCLLLLTKPCSILIKTAISKWSPHEETPSNNSLQNAGKWIGYLERLLIFIFVIIGKFEAIGFLLAAKSIFRFGDLKQGDDRRLTEYVLIGTLLSFGIAIVIGLLYYKGQHSELP
ncbi:DUF3307 domain-containing protein [Olivibacter sp. XZL3]|uniref:DUF3307 domain-containing protein n=1 Tax=Olivibacter sp. XZL3 TaxID=1735116 RepID=UPI001065C266|nr:DUF3307 domain-containing protein [Olivibacter sp. XZL3]